MARRYPPTELSETLRAARAARPGLTQHDVAVAIGGVPFTYVSRWERAEVRPDLPNLVRLAEFYDLDLGDLVRMRNAAPPSGRGRPDPGDAPTRADAEGAAAVDLPDEVATAMRAVDELVDQVPPPPGDALAPKASARGRARR